MKERIALVAILALVLAATGCAWMMPDADPLVVYRRQSAGSKGSILIAMWQMTVDVNGKITAVANPGNVLSTVPKVDRASNDFIAELRSALESDEMQSLRPEQLLESSRKVKTPEYTYTLIYSGRVLQTVSGAIPPEMLRALRLLDQKLQIMDSQATAPGVDQFGTIPQAPATPTRPAATPLAPPKPAARGTATPVR